MRSAGFARIFRSFWADDGDQPSDLISLADYERAATSILSPGSLGYLEGGAGDEITLNDNVAAWRPAGDRSAGARRGWAAADLGVEILGRMRPHPIVVAPTAFQRLVHPDGEPGTARAAAATDTIMCLSTFATTSPEALAGAVPEVARWFQLYVLKDRGISRELVAGAAKAAAMRRSS